MELHRFDLNLLVTLDALLSERNVTRAGLRMNLSQSAMSGALGRLREFFQDELLVPMGRTMVLTPLAQDLMQPVRDVLLQVQSTIATKPRFDPATSTRHVSVAVSDYVTSVLMADFLRDLQCQAPSITFDLRPVGKRAAEDLESGELDLLIAPEMFASPVHPKEVLFEDTHTCIAWNKSKQVKTHWGATPHGHGSARNHRDHKGCAAACPCRANPQSCQRDAVLNHRGRS